MCMKKIEKETDYINPHGLYIDIFPLDGVPANFFEKFFDLIRYGTAYCRMMYLFRRGAHASFAGRAAEFVGKFLGLFYTNKKTKNDFAFILDKWLKKYPVTNRKFVRVGDISARFQRKEYTFPKSVFTKMKMVPFENTEVPVPEDFDTALRALYGATYMTPPPLEKRVSEHSKVAKATWYYGPESN